MQSASQYDQHVRAHLQSIQEDAFARGEWSSEDLFECEKGCGFEDAAEDVVVAHEATCVFESVPEEQAAAAEPEPAEIYECEKGCGFENASEATVVAHEALCVFEPREYECEMGCGFVDICEASLVAHEATCTYTKLEQVRHTLYASPDRTPTVS